MIRFDVTTDKIIDNVQKSNIQYTLIWKDDEGILNFKYFLEFQKLKAYIRDCIPNSSMYNLKSVDKENTIYFLEKN